MKPPRVIGLIAVLCVLMGIAGAQGGVPALFYVALCGLLACGVAGIVVAVRRKPAKRPRESS